MSVKSEQFVALPFITAVEGDTTPDPGSVVLAVSEAIPNEPVFWDGTKWRRLKGVTRTLNFVIGDGATVITTGAKPVYIYVPFAFVPLAWHVAADISGSIVLDVWADSAAFPPTVADTVAGSEKPSLTGARVNQDLSLATWATPVPAGCWWMVNVDSAATVRRVCLTVVGRET